MKLEILIHHLEPKQRLHPNLNPDVSAICFDSRKVSPGTLFVAVCGTQTDGHQYITQAIEKGAVAIVCEKFVEQPVPQVPYIVVEDSKEALGLLASAFWGHPSRALHLIGITGTNGKTTTATLLYRLFKDLGYACGLISTIENYVDNTVLPSTHTTPDALELNQLLADMVAGGCAYCFMEVSSHAIDQGRISGIRFSGSVFTNLTHDHLDYHITFAEYLRCKKRLFDHLPSDAFALVNIDDKNGKVMLQNTIANRYSYACKTMADFSGRVIEQSVEGMLVRIDGTEISTSIIGRHNAYNLLAVYAVARLLGVPKEEVLPLLSTLQCVSGRLEYVKGGNQITAVIDYSHTPDALKNALSTLNDILAPNQSLYTVVGCGGNRDKTKRPEMARIAVENSTQAIFTSDNPRFEDPLDILNDMLLGLTDQERARCLSIPDRREAIKTAIVMAPPKSIILVAGKGHEDYQDIKGVKHHFDDKEICYTTFLNI
ncbi:MAG: UDP-N-acetylmuramoyl-L-alanyl-D-glutamate--2,6-diaminopimelate ligase [Bacteroidales bacterium]|nr:UDP-N-acetylmuramoyl-L-alanyl-D-glutamate--2,6-diaminopimelate ligase [Bacteroidales bacterium]